MKIKPLLNNVVIEDLKPEAKTKSGIVLPTSAQGEPQMASVIAVGTGEVVNGKTLPMQVSVGDKVLYSKYAGNEFKLEGQTLKILSQNDIVAIIEN